MTESNLEEIGLESFALGQTPTSEAVTDAGDVVVAADPDMAYCIVTLFTVTGGSVFMARGVAAVDDAGHLMVVNERLKLFGGQSVQMIAGTAAQTATVGVQTFLRGLPRQGVAV